FFSSRRRHTRSKRDWSSDVCSSDLTNTNNEEANASSEDKELTFGLITWTENIAVNNVWKVLLEEEGYDVELNQLDMGIIMESLNTGDLDVGIEVWLQ